MAVLKLKNPVTNLWEDIPTIQGIQGIQGKSAYQVALDNGFVGTQAQWLLTLKGDQGIQGDMGDGLEVKDIYDTLLELTTAHPTGVSGDVYGVRVGGDVQLYIWSVTSSDWELFALIGAMGTVEWVDILNKPTTFPPSTHTHPIDPILENMHTISKSPTGFTNNENIVVTYDSVARTVTLTGSFEAYFNGKVVPVLTDGWVSPAHVAVAGNYYLYYNGTDFVFTTTPWTFDMLMIAFVQYNSHKIALREVHGFMAYQTHENLHNTIGAYKYSGGDFSGYTLSSVTPANRRPQVGLTVVNDEDLKTTLPALTTNSYTQRYLTGAGDRTFAILQTEMVPNNGTKPYWNQFTGGNWVQTLMNGGQYGAIFVVAVPMTSDAGSQIYRYMFVQPQQVGTLVSIQALTPSSLTHGDSANLLSEFVFIGKIIIRCGASDWDIESVQKLEGTKISQVALSGNFLSTVTTDATLSGNGTVGSPLGVQQVLSVNGIKFPSTQIPSSDVNTLDDYEEGTWTPTLIGTTTAGVQTYSAQNGSYVKIGKLVFISFRVTLTAKGGTIAGNIRVGGLPFPIASLATLNFGVLFGITMASGFTVQFGSSSTSGGFDIMSLSDGSWSNVTVANMANNADIIATAFYMVA